MRSARDELDALRRQHLYRKLRTVEGGQGPRIRVDGQDLLNFSSNDYLGLASDPELASAVGEGLEKYGTGAGASRLISGNMAPHRVLEEKMADLMGKEDALLFSSGFSAAAGLFSAIAGKDDIIVLDKLCHACLVDGARATGATIRVFPHNNVEAMRERLRWGREKCPANGRLILVTESIFSMDGDAPPLREIVDTAKELEALIILDEAHAFGVLGPEGRGFAAELDVANDIDVLMTTLGKSAGLSGGVILARAELLELIVNRGRSFIFSTALPPAIAHGGLTAVDIIAGKKGRKLRDGLKKNAEELADELGVPHPSAAIIPVLIGDEEKAVQASSGLAANGILVPAVRYPTVGKKKARLRVTLMATHSSSDITTLAQALRLSLRQNETAGPTTIK